MGIKRALRLATELGIGITALSVAVLAGCGGGSKNNAGSTQVSSQAGMNVTPGKGKMIGAMVTVRDVDGNFLGNAYTTSAGVAAVSISPSAAAPFIVSVSCLASCQYFDEKSMSWLAGSATMPPLLAAVPTASLGNVGVSAATHAAAQYAIAAGHRTPAAITAVNNAVAGLMGLSGVPDILIAPRIISDATSLSFARAGATSADLLANYSAALAQAASGVSAIEAIAAYGDAWKQAALSQASSLTVPPGIDPAVVAQYAPGFVLAPAGIASAVAAQVQLVASEVAAVNHMLADATPTGGGLREWLPAFSGKGGGMAPHVAHIHTLVAAGRNTYAGTSSYRELVAANWVALSPDYQPSYYVPGAAGWQMYDQADTFTDNLNGTITSTSSRGVVIERVIETALDGQPVVCTDPATGAVVACAAPGNYPAGARRYGGAGGKASKDLYRIWPTDAYSTSTVFAMNGAALTALPVLGTDSFCSPGGVFVPIANAATWVDNYTVYPAADCTAAGISTAMRSTPAGTVRLTPKPTGNSVVPTVIIAYAPLTSTVSWLNNRILALVSGRVMEGSFRPAGSSATRVFYVNKIALDAELAAHGIAPAP